MRQIKLILVLLVSGMTVSSCTIFNRKHNAGIAVEVNGKYLEYSELDQLTMGLSPEDSATVADNYIKQWSTEVLLYDKARNKVDDKHIEALVEDYRRSLYAHAYFSMDSMFFASVLPIAFFTFSKSGAPFGTISSKPFTSASFSTY